MSRRSQIERDIYNDIRDAVSDWNCRFKKYHEDGYFCVDVIVKDRDADWDEVYNVLEEVANDWGMGIDQTMNEFYLAVWIEE